MARITKAQIKAVKSKVKEKALPASKYVRLAWEAGRILTKKTAMIKFVVLVAMLLATPCMAWDGYDYDKRSFLEIEKGNLVRRGRTIDIYDYDDGQYKDVEVENIQRIPRAVGIEVFDSGTGENRTFEMDE